MARAKERVSLRAFAAYLGVSHPAVRKAISTGRLRKSVGRDARGPFVSDKALGRREWAAGASKPANRGGNGHAKPSGGDASLVAAQVRVAGERATSLELANKRKRGELVDAATVEREHFEIARMLRERILNVADRLADLGPAIRARIRTELRQALGDLADDLERE